MIQYCEDSWLASDRQGSNLGRLKYILEYDFSFGTVPVIEHIES